MTIRPEFLEAAIFAADPLLARRIENMRIGLERGDAPPSKAWTEDIESTKNAARVRVRRVLAALNGINVEKECAQWTESPAIVSRATVTELCEAFCSEEVFAAVETAIGSDRAVALMGILTSL